LAIELNFHSLKTDDLEATLGLFLWDARPDDGMRQPKIKHKKEIEHKKGYKKVCIPTQSYSLKMEI